MNANSRIRWLRSVVLSLLLLSVPNVAKAIFVEAPTFGEMVEKSGSAFQGKVTGKSSRLEVTEDGRCIVTSIVFQVLKTYKGQFNSPVTLDFLGGKVGDLEMGVEGMPTFKVGETVVLFLDKNPKAACPVFAWTYGVYHVEPQTSQAPATVTGRTPLPISSSAQHPAASQAKGSSSDTPAQVDLAAFEAALRAVLDVVTPKSPSTSTGSP